MSKDFVFKNNNTKGFSKNLGKFIKDDERNIILRCCNLVSYEDIVSFSKEINCSKNKKKFTQEREFRGEELIKKNNETIIFGDENYDIFNVVFIANHREYLNFMKNKYIRDKMAVSSEHNSFFILIIPDTFDPLDSEEASFMLNEKEENPLEFINIDNVEEEFFLINIDIFKERKVERRTDLSDIVNPEMETSYFTYGFKGMSQNQRWELVSTLKIDIKIVNELISTGVLELGDNNIAEDVKKSYEFLTLNELNNTEDNRRKIFAFSKWWKSIKKAVMRRFNIYANSMF